jgi:hypothetical protein
MKGLKIPKNQSEARKSQDGQHNKMAFGYMTQKMTKMLISEK